MEYIYIWNCILQVVKGFRDIDVQFCWEPKVVVKFKERLEDMTTYFKRNMYGPNGS